jgi:hypothetical protein
MARYRVMAWREIPSQVKATDDSGATATRMLPNRWQQEIDRVAMREDLTGTDAYLELWAWGPEQERPGTAEEVAEAVLAELVAVGLPHSGDCSGGSEARSPPSWTGGRAGGRKGPCGHGRRRGPPSAAARADTSRTDQTLNRISSTSPSRTG